MKDLLTLHLTTTDTFVCIQLSTLFRDLSKLVTRYEQVWLEPGWKSSKATAKLPARDDKQLESRDPFQPLLNTNPFPIVLRRVISTESVEILQAWEEK